MMNHIRGNLWLLVLTFLVCSGLYPVTLWAIGQMVFRDQAQGSLIRNKEGKVIGSRLIAQPFTGAEYFQPRPSAASYNGMASSGTNWGPNNYLLRNRVAQQLGPIVRYGKGAEKIGKKPAEGVQEDIEAWFQKDRYQNEPGIVNQWLGLHSGLAEGWVKSTGDAVKGQWKQGDKDPAPNESFMKQWEADLPELFTAWKQSDGYKDWQKANPKDEVPSNADLAKAVLESFSKKHPGEWLALEEFETKDKQQAKRLARIKTGSDIQSNFFDMWRQDHPDVPLESVPADMVMASGSGLDPHITLDNARYQLKYRVAGAHADKIVADQAEPLLKAKGDSATNEQKKVILAGVRKQLDAKVGGNLEDKVRAAIDKVLTENQHAPLRGLVGVPIVNVLQLNLAVQTCMEDFAKAIR